MESYFEEFPARRTSYGHVAITFVVGLAGIFGASPLVMLFLAALGVVGNLLLGQFVHDRVSPAYSDGHPLVNLPPDGVTQS